MDPIVRLLFLIVASTLIGGFGTFGFLLLLMRLQGGSAGTIASPAFAGQSPSPASAEDSRTAVLEVDGKRLYVKILDPEPFPTIRLYGPNLEKMSGESIPAAHHPEATPTKVS